MKNLLMLVEEFTSSISNFIWPIFLPFLLAISAFIILITFKKIKKSIKKDKKLSFKKMIGPASISLGAKIGTGSIIGVLGSISKVAESGQLYIEGIILWGLIGASILVLLTFSETFISRMLNKTPPEYISENISFNASKVYMIALIILYIFGIGGFQFNGIDTVFTISYENIFNNYLTEVHRYLFIILPIILVVSSIILTKKHVIFIDVLSTMIGFAVILYFLFFTYFIFKTSFYIPKFLNRVLLGFFNPKSIGLGIPAGLLFGIQRIIQTSEAGLGTSPLASNEGKSMGVYNSALTQVIPTIITIFVSLLVTTYITSFGLYTKQIVLPAEGIDRIISYFNTAQSITGTPGLIILFIFALLSGMTTLLGSYYFLTQLFTKNSENINILIYIILVFLAGTLSVFGFDVIFDIVDILLFVVSGLNVLALAFLIKNIYLNNKDLNKNNHKKIAK